MTLSAKARRIKAVILDVDGVLTDGRFGYGDGDGEIKFFHARDGHALKLLQRAGIRTGILSGRSSQANTRRALELSMDFVYQGEKDKREAFGRLLTAADLASDEVLYVGDDLVDVPVIRRAGVGVAVADAVPEVKETADWTTTERGGHGAVREVAVWLLKEKGLWESVYARYST